MAGKLYEKFRNKQLIKRCRLNEWAEIDNRINCYS